jgi:hypothetical protein
MAKEAFDIPPGLRDEVIGLMLAGLEVPSKGLGVEACAQIRSWREVNLVGAPVSARSTYWVSTGVDLALAGLCLLGLRWAVKRYRSG